MPRPKLPKDEAKSLVLSVRLNATQAQQLEEVEDLLRVSTGISLTRTQVVGKALEIGLAELEKMHKRKRPA